MSLNAFLTLLNNRILYLSKIKAFADKISIPQKKHCRKRKNNACFQNFSPFPKIPSKALSSVKTWDCVVKR